MQLPLLTFVTTAMLVATAGLANAGTDPPTLYFTVNPSTGESWKTESRTDRYWETDGDGVRADVPQTTYDSHTNNFWGEHPFPPPAPTTSHIRDDYQMADWVSIPQLLVNHYFRVGFGGSGQADGRLRITFSDAANEKVSSYLINLTGNEIFGTFSVFFTDPLPVASKGYVKFEWLNPENARYGLMSMAPLVGHNDTNVLYHNDWLVSPPMGAFGGISQKLVTVDIPAPGSVAPLALAGFGLLTHRRKR